MLGYIKLYGCHMLGYIKLYGCHMLEVVGLPNNSYKPITNTAWVRARLCKLQKRVHLTRSRK